MTLEDEVVTVERQDRIALLTLNRPDKRNAINEAAIAGLNGFFAAPPQGLAAIVIQGAGPHFCAGLDLSEVLEKQRDAMQSIQHSRGWHRTFDLIQFGDVPVISCLKGGVIGGGLELAAATHIRICEPSTFFQMPEGQRGIFLGGGGSVRIPRLLGAGRVVELMLTARKVDVEEGIRLGLGHRLVQEGAGLKVALEVATQVSANLATSNYAIINGIARIAEMSPAEGLFTETMTAVMAGSARETHNRIREFFDKKRET